MNLECKILIRIYSRIIYQSKIPQIKSLINIEGAAGATLYGNSDEIRKASKEQHKAFIFNVLRIH